MKEKDDRKEMVSLVLFWLYDKMANEKRQETDGSRTKPPHPDSYRDQPCKRVIILVNAPSKIQQP